MTVKTLRNRINSLCTHVLFDYNIEEVMETPFFDGKALQDIVDQVENVDGM